MDIPFQCTNEDSGLDCGNGGASLSTEFVAHVRVSKPVDLDLVFDNISRIPLLAMSTWLVAVTMSSACMICLMTTRDNYQFPIRRLGGKEIEKI